MWIEKLGDRKFKYNERYVDRYTERYKRVSVILTSESAQAKRKAENILSEKIAAEMAKSIHDKMTFRQVFEKWYPPYLRTIRPSSRVITNSIKKIIFEKFKVNSLMRNIDTSLIQDFLDNLDYSNEYLSSIKSMLNLVFKFAKKNDYIKDNPIFDVEIHYRSKTVADFDRIENKFLEHDQAEKLIKELYRRPSSYRLANLAEFMFLTGMRIGKATILRPENFNFEQSFVEVTGTLDKTQGYRNAKKGPTKTAKGTRRVDLTPRCVNLVKRVIEENIATKLDNAKYQERGFIFVTKNGVPIHSNSFNTALKLH